MSQRERIDQALRLDQWRSLALDFRKSWGILTLLVATLLGVVIWFTSPKVVEDGVYGITLGFHQRQSETGRGALVASVRLDVTGQVVSVIVPRSQPNRVNAMMELSASRRAWFPSSRTYYFVRYVDDPLDARSHPRARPNSNSAPQTETAE